MFKALLRLIGVIIYGAAAAFGTVLGIALFTVVRDPVERAKFKKKLKNIKNAVRKNTERS